MHFQLQVTGLAISRAAIASLVIAAFSWATAKAEVVSQKERLTYQVMFGGLHVGDILIGLDQTSAGYATEMKLTARGVAQMFQNFRANITGEGTFVEAASATPSMKPLPAAFSREWAADKFASVLTMSYDPLTRAATTQERMFNPLTGEELKREDMPWGNGGRGGNNRLQPVPMDMRANALDPMAAFVAARHQIMAQGGASSGPKSFRVPIYDGSRRYDVTGKTGAVRTVTINNVERKVVPVTAGIEPVFGFRRGSEERTRESEGKLYFSADERFVPVQVVMGNDMFTVVMNQVGDCAIDPAPCDMFKQEAHAR